MIGLRVLLLALTGHMASFGAAAPVAGPGPRFGEAIAPIFEAKCVKCHGPGEANGALRLDSYDAVMRGGQRGPAIVGNDLRASILFQKVVRRDRPAMPPKRKLTRHEVHAIEAWIRAGAPP